MLTINIPLLLDKLWGSSFFYTRLQEVTKFPGANNDIKRNICDLYLILRTRENIDSELLFWTIIVKIQTKGWEKENGILDIKD